MKETIYSIPVSEAFEQECECSLCALETKLEDEYVDYVLGASLMEPDSRKETNEKGFCRKHFELIYKKQENKLGLGLIIDTHMVTQNQKLNRLTGMRPEYQDALRPGQQEAPTQTMSLKGAVSAILGRKREKAEKGTEAVTGGSGAIDRIISYIDEHEKSCYICDKLDYTMRRYIEVIYHLYFSESDFRRLFESKKGFCLPHLKQMLKAAKKLDPKKRDQVVAVILKMQTDHMERVQKEINWFTKKFDYRYEEEPWGNSKDAIPRSIRKLMGPCRLK